MMDVDAEGLRGGLGMARPGPEQGGSGQSRQEIAPVDHLRIIQCSGALPDVSFLSEIWQFLRVRKKLWLLPMLLLMLFFGGLIVFAQTSALAPFIYTLF